MFGWGWHTMWFFNCDYDYLDIDTLKHDQQRPYMTEKWKVQQRERINKISMAQKGHLTFRRNAVRHK